MSNEELIEEESTQVIAGEQSIIDIYNKNKKSIQIGGIAILALLIGGWYYFSQYKPGLEIDAQNAAFQGERYFAVDSFNKALNGDINAPGLKDVASDYSGTKAGEFAGYYSGKALLEQGKFQEALDYLEDVSFEDEIMAAQVITLEGDCHSELGDYSTAGDVYMKAANKRDNSLTTPIALYKAGLAYEEAAEFKNALSAWEKLFKDYPKSSNASKAEAYIAKLKAKIASK